jgi:hypothetical protein
VASSSYHLEVEIVSRPTRAIGAVRSALCRAGPDPLGNPSLEQSPLVVVIQISLSHPPRDDCRNGCLILARPSQIRVGQSALRQPVRCSGADGDAGNAARRMERTPPTSSAGEGSRIDGGTPRAPVDGSHVLGRRSPHHWLATAAPTQDSVVSPATGARRAVRCSAGWKAPEQR